MAKQIERWIDRHSINCIKCGNLVDERDCVRHKVEGEMCLECQKIYPNGVEKCQ